MNVIVLGGGLVGGPMAIDLASGNEFQVTVCDIDPDIFRKFKGTSIKAIRGDLSDKGFLSDTLPAFDFVVNAVPGFMGFETLKRVIESGKNVIDIAFFPEDLFELDQLATQKGITAISDIGVAPGMSNVLIGYADHLLDETESAVTYVGGLPKVRSWPYEYKAVFSPVDVIEEYTRPARYIENGKLVVKPALSDPELLEFEGVGTLEAFNSDGLRSLAKTIKANYLIEKTLRYPGHIDIMRILRHSGFFDRKEIDIKGKKIRPLDLTSKLLFDQWKLSEKEEDITVMKIIVEGKKNGKKRRYTWDLFDTYDPATNVHSMARTTGYTATMALRMLAERKYTRKGISPPEFIGKHPECVDFLLEGLRQRNIIYMGKVEDFQK